MVAFSAHNDDRWQEKRRRVDLCDCCIMFVMILKRYPERVTTYLWKGGSAVTLILIKWVLYSSFALVLFVACNWRIWGTFEISEKEVLHTDWTFDPWLASPSHPREDATRSEWSTYQFLPSLRFYNNTLFFAVVRVRCALFEMLKFEVVAELTPSVQEGDSSSMKLAVFRKAWLTSSKGTCLKWP